MGKWLGGQVRRSTGTQKSRGHDYTHRSAHGLAGGPVIAPIASILSQLRGWVLRSYDPSSVSTASTVTGAFAALFAVSCRCIGVAIRPLELMRHKRLCEPGTVAV